MLLPLLIVVLCPIPNAGGIRSWSIIRSKRPASEMVLNSTPSHCLMSYNILKLYRCLLYGRVLRRNEKLISLSYHSCFFLSGGLAELGSNPMLCCNIFLYQLNERATHHVYFTTLSYPGNPGDGQKISFM